VQRKSLELIMDKIILFGGTFDPIHKGHIKIAEHAFKTLKAKQLFFIPTSLSIFKNTEPTP
jgi:nicotinate-nucleotide adenylyltransferase